MVDVTPLDRVVGERLRLLRTESGVSLEEIAAEARRCGLGWAKSSVAALEAGRHSLDLGELLLLPTILGRAQVWAYEYEQVRSPARGDERVKVGRHPVGLADLIPDDDRLVRLAGRAHTSTRSLRALFAQLQDQRIDVVGAEPTVGEEAAKQAERLPARWCQGIFEAIREHHRKRTPPRGWHPDDDEEFWPSIGQDVADDANRTAAAVLGVPPIAVALAARARWNGVWGLTGEREHRLAVLLPGMHRDTAPGRKLQALRGHITRQLLDELRPVLKGSAPKKKRRTR